MVLKADVVFSTTLFYINCENKVFQISVSKTKYLKFSKLQKVFNKRRFNFPILERFVFVLTLNIMLFKLKV